MLINNASLAAKLSQPYLSAYVAANHGVRGLSMSLRQELLLEGLRTSMFARWFRPASTRLSTSMPATTPAAPPSRSPVYTPDQVAETFIRLAENPRHEVYVGNAARTLSFESLLAPEMTERQLAVMTDKMLLKDQPIPPTAGTSSNRSPSGPVFAEDGRSTVISPSPCRRSGAAILAPILLMAWFRLGMKTTLPGETLKHDRFP